MEKERIWLLWFTNIRWRIFKWGKNGKGKKYDYNYDEKLIIIL